MKIKTKLSLTFDQPAHFGVTAVSSYAHMFNPKYRFTGGAADPYQRAGSMAGT